MGTDARSREEGSARELVVVALEREGAKAVASAAENVLRSTDYDEDLGPGLEAIDALWRALGGDEHEEEKILRLGIETLEELLGRQTVLVTDLSSDGHVALLRLLNLLRSQEVDHGV